MSRSDLDVQCFQVLQDGSFRHDPLSRGHAGKPKIDTSVSVGNRITIVDEPDTGKLSLFQ
jgi:hypothetical protein